MKKSQYFILTSNTKSNFHFKQVENNQLRSFHRSSGSTRYSFLEIVWKLQRKRASGSWVKVVLSTTFHGLHQQVELSPCSCQPFSRAVSEWVTFVHWANATSWWSPWDTVYLDSTTHRDHRKRVLMGHRYQCCHWVYGAAAGCTVFTCEEIKRQSSGNQAFRKLHPGVLINLLTLLYTSWKRCFSKTGGTALVTRTSKSTEQVLIWLTLISWRLKLILS